MPDLNKKNNLIIVSGLPGSGKSTLMVEKELRSKILKKLNQNENSFSLGGEKEFETILQDKKIINLFYHYAIFFEKDFWRLYYNKIEDLIKQFNKTTILICVCKSTDLAERFKKRESNRKRGILKNLNPFFIYSVKRMYHDYLNRDKVINYYKNWVNYTSKFDVNYFIVDTSKNVFYSIKKDQIYGALNNII